MKVSPISTNNNINYKAEIVPTESLGEGFKLAERCVKPFVVNRKVFQTSGSEAGAIYTVKLFSIVRTAIINGLDPYRYIKYVLENIKNKPVDDLLPYSKTLQKVM